MFYCRQDGYEYAHVPCYPSLCEDMACDYHITMIDQYNRTKKLILARQIDWCVKWCSEPCWSMYGGLCDQEIERLRDLGLTVEGVLRGEIKNVRKIISLDEYRLKK